MQPVSKHFGARLLNERMAAGYSSAKALVAIFTTHGIAMSYANYSRIEAGRQLPTFDFVLSVAAALKLQDLEQFVDAYLEDLPLSDSARAYVQARQALRNVDPELSSTQPTAAHDATETPNAPEKTDAQQLDATTSESESTPRVELTPAQARLVTADAQMYWFFLTTVLNPNAVDPRDLAGRGGLNADQCESLARRLVDAQLLRKVSHGYVARRAHIKFPPRFRDRVRQLSQELSLLSASEPLVWRTIFLKTSDAQMARFRERVNSFAAEFLNYEENTPGENRKLYLLSVQVQERPELNLPL